MFSGLGGFRRCTDEAGWKGLGLEIGKGGFGSWVPLKIGRLFLVLLGPKSQIRGRNGRDWWNSCYRGSSFLIPRVHPANCHFHVFSTFYDRWSMKNRIPSLVC